MTQVSIFSVFKYCQHFQVESWHHLTSLLFSATEELDHPFNPAEAKPFHILWDETDSFNVSYTSSISGEFDSVSLRCIFGRDGVNDSDWTVSVDNSGCSSSMTAISAVNTVAARPAVSAGVCGYWPTGLLVMAMIGVFGLFICFHRTDRVKSEYTALLSEL